MTEPMLRIDQVGKRFGGFVALDGINLSVAPGERLGVIIAPNGLVGLITQRLKAKERG
jgi:branched-chain amino acid transport system ATP-binding protein